MRRFEKRDAVIIAPGSEFRLPDGTFLRSIFSNNWLLNILFSYPQEIRW